MMHLESDHAQPFPVVMFYLVTCIKVMCVFCDLILFYECAPFHSSNTYWGCLSWFQRGSTRYCLMPIIFLTIIFSSSTLIWFLSLCGKCWSQVLSLSWLLYPVLEAYSWTFASEKHSHFASIHELGWAFDCDLSESTYQFGKNCKVISKSSISTHIKLAFRMLA